MRKKNLIFSLALLIIIAFGLGVYFFFLREPDMYFPSEPNGVLQKDPTITKNPDGGITVEWAIPIACSFNEIMAQQDEYRKNTSDYWGGAPAECLANTNGGSTCTASLPPLGEGNYGLQTHNAKCADGSYFISSVVEFSLQ